MKLFFRKYGEGPPFIILHGLFGSSDNWVHIARAIENCFSVYLPDLRNHGRSSWSAQHNYPAMADDIIEFADEQNLDKFFLGGHSMGGKAAIYCARNNPDRISGLFVADISPFQYHEGGLAFEQQQNILSIMTSVRPEKFKDRNDIENYLVSTAGEDTTRYILMKNIVFEAGKMRWRLNVASLKSNLNYLLEGLPRPPASSSIVCSFPVVFLKGSESTYINTGDISDIKNLFPGVHLHTAEGAGHWVHTEKPDEVIRVIREMRVLSLGEDCN